jgi:hypothetical protein
VADSQGISFWSVKGMDFRAREMRTLRAYGDGVAEIRVSGMVGCVVMAWPVEMMRGRNDLGKSRAPQRRDEWKSYVGNEERISH